MAEYKVGYKRPPVHTRFKKGEKSPNPSGRPKRRITQPTVLLEFERILGRHMRVNQNGRVQEISALQALLTQMVHKGIKGHTPTMGLAISLLFKVLATAEPDADEVSRTDAEALADIQAIFNQIASNLSASSEATASPPDKSAGVAADAKKPELDVAERPEPKD